MHKIFKIENLSLAFLNFASFDSHLLLVIYCTVLYLFVCSSVFSCNQIFDSFTLQLCLVVAFTPLWFFYLSESLHYILMCTLIYKWYAIASADLVLMHRLRTILYLTIYYIINLGLFWLTHGFEFMGHFLWPCMCECVSVCVWLYGCVCIWFPSVFLQYFSLSK